jgi:WD40 repeat protein
MLSRYRTGALVAVVVTTLMGWVAPKMTAQAQPEYVYFSQFNPSAMGAAVFDGTTLSQVDINPRSSALTLPASLDTSRWLTVTDRHLLGANLFQGLSAVIIDRQTGLELPRPRTTLNGSLATAASPNGSTGYILGSTVGTGALALSVVSLDPTSPHYSAEIGTLSIGATTGIGMVADPTQPRLYIQTNDATGVRLRTVDVTNPAAPMIIATTLATAPLPGAPAFEATGTGFLRTFSAGGELFLAVPRRSMHIYRVMADGSVVFVQALVSSPTSAQARDLAFVPGMGSPRAYVAVYDSTPLPATLTLRSFDMTLSSGVFAGTALGSVAVATNNPANLEGAGTKLAASGDGQTIYLMRPTIDGGQPGRIVALDASDVDASAPSAVKSTIPIGSTAGTAGQGMAVATAPAPSNLTITGIAVEGVPNAVLINDEARTVTVTGSGLENVSFASVGLTRVPVTAASANSVTLEVPALTPSATAPVLLSGPDGSAAATLTIANAPSVFSPYQIFASSSASNEVWVLNSATGSSVARAFAAGAGPNDAQPSSDGRVLVLNNFRGTTASVHSLINDAGLNVSADQLLATPTVGGSPQRIVINPVRPRAYSASLTTGVISIIDTDLYSATFGQVLGTVSGLNTATVANIRSMAITPDGRYLFAARNFAPHLLVIDVQSDTPAVTDRYFTTLATPPAEGQRLDGLTVSPDGARLYLSSSGETTVRVFDLSTPTAPVQIDTLVLPGAVFGDVRRMQVLPNQRFLYVSSRTKGVVDIYDLTLGGFVAQVPTGSFSSDPAVGPDSRFVYVAVGETDAVLTLDARETVGGLPNPTLHTVVAASTGGTGTVAVSVSKGLATDAGTGITISPAPGVELTFDSVTTTGLTTAGSSNAGEPGLPDQYVFGGIPVYTEINTTAQFEGTVTVCLSYDSATLSAEQEAAQRLLHAQSGVLVDTTTTVDVDADRVCGEVTSLGTFTVAMHDTAAPVITVPAAVTVSATSASGAVVSFDTPAASDGVSGIASFTCTHQGGVLYSLGTTLVSCVAEDRVGNSATASFTVTVSDTTPPVVTATTPDPVVATSVAGAVVTFTASALDAVDGALPVTCVPASGTVFRVGATPVSCTARDARGNVGSATFTVVVSPAPTTPVAKGRMKGDGSIRSGSTTVHFNFDIDRGVWEHHRHDDDKLRLKIDTEVRGKKQRFESTQVSSISFADNPVFRPGRPWWDRWVKADTVTVAGTGKYNGRAGYTFEMIATDQGEPGPGRDTFSIIVRDSSGAVVIELADELRSGNVQSLPVVGCGHRHDRNDRGDDRGNHGRKDR